MMMFAYCGTTFNSKELELKIYKLQCFPGFLRLLTSRELYSTNGRGRVFCCCQSSLRTSQGKNMLRSSPLWVMIGRLADLIDWKNFSFRLSILKTVTVVYFIVKSILGISLES